MNAKLRDVYTERDAFKDQANEYRIENVTLKASLGNVVHRSTTPSVVEREESLRLATLQGAHVVSALFGSASKPLSPVSNAPLFAAEPVADDGTLTSPAVAAAPSMPPSDAPSPVSTDVPLSPDEAKEAQRAIAAISDNDRSQIVALLMPVKKTLDVLNGVRPGVTQPANSRKYPYTWRTLIDHFVVPVNIKWQCVRHITTSFLGQWIRNADCRGRSIEGRPTVKDTPASVWEPIVAKCLEPLDQWSALTSVNLAMQWLFANWPPDAPCTIPCRTLVGDWIQKHHKKTVAQETKGLSDEEKAERKQRMINEVVLLIDMFGIVGEMIFNLDETCWRLIPRAQTVWLKKNNGSAASKAELMDFGERKDKTKIAPKRDRDGVSRDGRFNIFDHVALKRTYTTGTAGCSLVGEKLNFMINWKGTDALKVNAGNGVVEYCQQDTHWQTPASLCYYIENVVIPAAQENEFRRFGTRGERKWLLLVDCAPVHISKEMRAKFQQYATDKNGIITFVAAGCTATSQPMDIGYFNQFKRAAVAQHYLLLSQKLNFVRGPLARRLLCNSNEVRALAVMSVAYGTTRVSERPLAEAWREAFNVPSDKGIIEYLSSPEVVSRAKQQWAIDSKIHEAEDAIAAKFMQEHPNAKVPRGKMVSKIMFRFGPPFEKVDPRQYEDSVRDAAVTLEAQSRVPPSNPADDDDDSLIPYETEAGDTSDADVNTPLDPAVEAALDESREGRPRYVLTTEEILSL